MEEDKKLTYNDIVQFCQPRIYVNRNGESAGVHLPGANLVFPKSHYRNGTKTLYTLQEAKQIALERNGILPDLNEAHLIQMFLPQINAILSAIGGTPITAGWYWTDDESNGMGTQWGPKYQKTTSVNYKGKILIVYHLKKELQ